MNVRRSIVLAILLATPATSHAAPCILNSPPPTLREEAAQCKFLVYARPENTTKDGKESETTFFFIRDVIKDHAILAKRLPIDLGRMIPITDQRNPPSYLLFGDVFKNKPDIYRGIGCGSALVDYVRGLLAVVPKGEVEVLRYCFDFLSSAEKEVAADAFAEFRLASATAITCLAPKLDPAKLRRLLKDAKTMDHRGALFAYLLGNCGEARDSVLFRTLIERQIKEGNGYYLNDLLVGFTLIDPAMGWTTVRKLAEDRSGEFRVRYAALSAARFFHSDRPGVLAKADLVAVVDSLLDQEDIGDLAVVELRKWRHWDQTERVLALFSKKIGNEGSARLLRRSIVCYGLLCPEERCKAFIAEQRKQNPELVKQAEEIVAEEIRADKPKRYLYVVTPGIRDLLEFGGAGILVFDIDDGHKLVKRIATPASMEEKPNNIKGVCACAATKKLYFTTTKKLYCVDLVTEKTLWEKALPQGTDRMSMTPDGKVLYVPSFEKDIWNVVDGASGDVVATIEPKSGAHNTVVGLDGSRMYLAGLRSPLLSVADTKTHKLVTPVGPFAAAIRPFTVNAAQTLCFVNVNDLLGFEIGDLKTGKKLHRVEVEGFTKGPVKRHGCPSHGIGLTPDEKEIWLCDGHNSHIHVFDATQMPPKQTVSIKLREQPGWVTFSLDGRYAYPSTGEVIDVKTKKIVAVLTDEKGREVHSEKMVEIHFKDGVPLRNGDQFGVGRAGK